MTNAIRSIAFIVLLTVASSVAWSDPPTPSAGNPATQPQPQTTQNEANAPSNIPATPIAPAIVENLQPPTVPEPSETEETKARDYSSSEWWLVYLTGALVAVTTGLAVFTGYLYSATVQLGRDAKASGDTQAKMMEASIAQATRFAIAAEESNRNAIRAMKSDLRPWIKITAITIDKLTLDPKHGLSVALSCHFQNVGRSPANFVITHSDILFSGSQLIPWDYLTDIAKKPRPHPQIRQNTIFPNDEDNDSNAFYFHSPKVKAAHYIYIAVTVFYSFGEFDEVHRTCRLLQICPLDNTVVKFGDPVDFSKMPALSVDRPNVGDYAD